MFNYPNLIVISLLHFIFTNQISNSQFLQSLGTSPPTARKDSQLKDKMLSRFKASPIYGIDVGIGAEGAIYIVGVDGKWYTYNFASNSFTRIIADPDLDNIKRVDVDDEGTPFVITDCGATYYLSCDGRWIQLPGCSTDIGAGFCGQVWKTGCDERVGGYGIWKLFCSGHEKKCNRYRQFNYSAKYKGRINDRKKCSWYRISGAGTRVDVFPDGKPAVIQASGLAMKYNGNEWSLLTNYWGRDITVSNEGAVWMPGLTHGIYIIPEDTRDSTAFKDERYAATWNARSERRGMPSEELDKNTQYVDLGCTMAISAGPYSQPAMIPCIGEYSPVVVMTQKFDYN